eukprot:m.1283831 g.1283831  ORF g.1283831 m.1283831 type:complete len:387 (-) comp24777_c0_seq1:4799-5959(-)
MSRALHLLRPGARITTAWIRSPCQYVAEALAHHGGMHAVTCDLQHGAQDLSSLAFQLRAISAAKSIPSVRLPSHNDDFTIGKCADLGAEILIAPMVNSAADAQRLVGAARYPVGNYRDVGRRSWGPLCINGMRDPQRYFAESNQNLIVLAMIETVDAVDKLGEILAVPGIDGVFVGPSDLAISMGYAPSGVPTEPAVVDAIADIVKHVTATNKASGIYCGDGRMANAMFNLGYRLCGIGSDLGFLTAASQTEMRAASVHNTTTPQTHGVTETHTRITSTTPARDPATTAVSSVALDMRRSGTRDDDTTTVVSRAEPDTALGDAHGAAGHDVANTTDKDRAQTPSPTAGLSAEDQLAWARALDAFEEQTFSVMSSTARNGNIVDKIR